MTDTVPTDRYALAQATAERIFGRRVQTTPWPHEPESSVEMRRVWAASGFADAWNRTAIDDRTRSMITVAVLTAIGCETEMKVHIDGALTIGVTPDELVDVFAQVGQYAGVPRAGEGLKAMCKNVARRAERTEASPEPLESSS